MLHRKRSIHKRNVKQSRVSEEDNEVCRIMKMFEDEDKREEVITVFIMLSLFYELSIPR